MGVKALGAVGMVFQSQKQWLGKSPDAISLTVDCENHLLQSAATIESGLNTNFLNAVNENKTAFMNCVHEHYSSTHHKNGLNCQLWDPWMDSKSLLQ